MESKWEEVAKGTSEGWVYTIETQELNGKIFTRIRPGNQSFRALDGSYDDIKEAAAAAKSFAESAIREIRAAEGYPPG